MSKFNEKGTKPARKSGPVTPMTTTGTTTTYEGGNAFVRDQKSELYLLAVTNMVGEDTFYERAKKRDDRFCALIHQVVKVDPGWAFRMLGWLRNKANMRSASVVFAAEAVWARLDAGLHGTFTVSRPGSSWEMPEEYEYGSKHFVPQGLARGDEPKELIAYWTSKYGKNLPMPLKRGLALALEKLVDEYSYSKYGKTGEWQIADVIELVHPKTKDPKQNDLYRHALNERHKRDEPIPDSLLMLQRRRDVMAMDQDKRRAFLSRESGRDIFKAAGLTWESASGWLGGELDAAFWETMIPSMGYMALLRNLRNFEKAGISKKARKAVQERLSDPEQVRRSRQFPYRFLSAYKAVQGDWWNEALSDALDASVGNLPQFGGRTLVLSDTSGSMATCVSEKSEVTYLEIAALFAVALSRAGADVDLFGFAGDNSSWNRRGTSKVCFQHTLAKGGSVLKGVQSFTARRGEVGHGTELDRAFAEAYAGHDRVVIVSDMQSFGSYQGDITTACPADVRLYGLNVAGYAGGVIDLSKRNRYEIGGFSDQVFRQISLLEAGDGQYPF
jgi:hypothetical protein